MHDNTLTRPDHQALFRHASEWRGYFTTKQAKACGFEPNLLNYHVKYGRFIRVRRGLYRFRDFPGMPHDELVQALLKVGIEEALISHQSALEVLELSDVIPNIISITVPRSRRYLRAPEGVRLHTSSREIWPRDRVERNGIRMTAAARSILDSAEVGLAPEQVELAVWQAIQRGLTTKTELVSDVQDRSAYVRAIIERALEELSREIRVR